MPHLRPSTGRYVIKEPEHPLANPKGYLTLARAVAYDVWGPGEQECYWCGKVIVWKHQDPEQRINTDHLNGDRTDDRITNLVPSCRACNFHRARRPELIEARRRELECRRLD